MSPRTTVGVAGTATEVGKTWTTAALCRELRRRGLHVSARKPVQSCEPDDPEDTTDGAILAAATGEPYDIVCPPDRRYRVALAPPMAAAATGRICPSIDELAAEIASSWAGTTPPVSLGFVETVGGTRSPTARPSASGDDSVALLAALDVDATVLVADAGLGTIDAVRRSVPGCPTPVLVALNRFDASNSLHRDNAAWLTDVDGLSVVTSVTGLADALLERFPAQ